MFSLGTWGEVLIIALVALVLLGPKELPVLLRALGRWVQKFRHVSSGIRQEMQRYIHEGEFEEYTKNINTPFIDPDVPAKTKNKRVKSPHGRTKTKK
jgi:sec-independent protein translocase protein TatB